MTELEYQLMLDILFEIKQRLAAIEEALKARSVSDEQQTDRH
jgi:hypothetical protein